MTQKAKQQIEQSVETELKLTLTDEGMRRLFVDERFQLPEGDRPKQRHLVATYFDTPDQALVRQGIMLRVRRNGERFIQTLKTTGVPGVAADRGEWEWEIKAEKPDVSLLTNTSVAGQLPDRLAAKLRPMFVTDINRTSWNLQLDCGTTVEAALDAGKVTAGSSQEPVRELELELRHGMRGPLYRLALDLHAMAPLAVAVESKGERGYRLLERTAPTGEKAPDIHLVPGTATAEGFRQITESVLGHLLTNRTAALSGAKEGIHQMRVAIRRLRAALVLFKPLLEPHGRTQFEDELRRIGRVFGEARDWDVFCTEILASTAQTSAAVGWLDLLKKPADLRLAAAHAEFAKECHAPAFTAMVLGLAGWAEDGPAATELVGAKKLRQPIGAVASDLLDVLANKVDRRGRHIDRRSGAELHALRKSLKKLRYGIEFLGSLFPGKGRKRYQHQCKTLQKILGSINDTVMAAHCAESLAKGSHVPLAPAIALLSQCLEHQKRAGHHELNEAWETFRETQRFWR